MDECENLLYIQNIGNHHVVPFSKIKKWRLIHLQWNVKSSSMPNIMSLNERGITCVLHLCYSLFQFWTNDKSPSVQKQKDSHQSFMMSIIYFEDEYKHLAKLSKQWKKNSNLHCYTISRSFSCRTPDICYSILIQEMKVHWKCFEVYASTIINAPLATPTFGQKLRTKT